MGGARGWVPRAAAGVTSASTAHGLFCPPLPPGARTGPCSLSPDLLCALSLCISGSSVAEAPGRREGLRAAPALGPRLLCKWRRWKRGGRHCSPFNYVQAQLAAIRQGNEFQARAHAHALPHLFRDLKYPSDLSGTRDETHRLSKCARRKHQCSSRKETHQTGTCGGPCCVSIWAAASPSTVFR